MEEGKHSDNNNGYLNLPLLHDEKQSQLNGEQSPRSSNEIHGDDDEASNGNTSLLKTCVNGLNALSGSFLITTSTYIISPCL